MLSSGRCVFPVDALTARSSAEEPKPNRTFVNSQDLTGSLLEPMMPSTPKLGHLMYWLPTIRYYIIIYMLGFKSDYYADTVSCSWLDKCTSLPTGVSVRPEEMFNSFKFQSIIPLYMDHFPDGTSARNLLYYIQVSGYSQNRLPGLGRTKADRFTQ